MERRDRSTAVLSGSTWEIPEDLKDFDYPSDFPSEYESDATQNLERQEDLSVDSDPLQNAEQEYQQFMANSSVSGSENGVRFEKERVRKHFEQIPKVIDPKGLETRQDGDAIVNQGYVDDDDEEEEEREEEGGKNRVFDYLGIIDYPTNRFPTNTDGATKKKKATIRLNGGSSSSREAGPPAPSPPSNQQPVISSRGILLTPERTDKQSPPYEKVEWRAKKVSVAIRSSPSGASDDWRDADSIMSAPSYFDEPKISLCERFNNFVQSLSSDRMQGASRAVSQLCALLLVAIAFTLELSSVLPGHPVPEDATHEFYIALHVLSCFFMTMFFLWGYTNKLTSDDHYRDQSNMQFLRGGAVILGTGGIIYELLEIGLNVAYGCGTPLLMANAATGAIFFLMQIAVILNYSRLRVNKRASVAMICRFGLMTIVATDLSMWVRTVVLETMHEVHLHETGQQDNASDPHSVNSVSSFAGDSGLSDGCKTANEVKDLVAPFVFPLLIEFCVIGASITIAIWEKCGMHGHSRPRSVSDFGDDGRSRAGTIDDDNLDSVSMAGSTAGQSMFGGSPEENRRRYHNRHIGFILGWIFISASIVLIIVFLYLINKDGLSTVLEDLVYGYILLLAGIALLAIPLAIIQMSQLTFKDQEIKKVRKKRANLEHKEGKSIVRQLDMSLLERTFVAVLVFEILVMISSISNSPLDLIVFCSALVSVVQGLVQLLFINWYAFHKRVAKEEHLVTKPGRQCLEALRCLNLALWFCHTFLIKNVQLKTKHIAVFGFEAWTILSNVFQPLNILFYFHSMACYADVITHTFTDKYVGVMRSAKKQRRARAFSVASVAGQA